MSEVKNIKFKRNNDYLAEVLDHVELDDDLVMLIRLVRHWEIHRQVTDEEPEIDWLEIASDIQIGKVESSLYRLEQEMVTLQLKLPVSAEKLSAHIEHVRLAVKRLKDIN